MAPLGQLPSSLAVVPRVPYNSIPAALSTYHRNLELSQTKLVLYQIPIQSSQIQAQKRAYE